jgi:hypothetical protein
MTTTEQRTPRPAVGPVGAAWAALVVVLVALALGAALWSVDRQAVTIVVAGAVLVFSAIGAVLLAVRETRWLGAGLLGGSAVVAAIGLVVGLAHVAGVGS